MRPSFSLPDPDHFTTGTIGPPGQRTFYLQTGAEGAVVSFKVEKQQVAALARHLSEMLADLPGPEVPASPAPELVEPLLPEWEIGGIGIAYDPSSDRVLVVIHEAVAEAEDGGDHSEPGGDAGEEAGGSDGAVARLLLTRSQVAAFIERAGELMAASRPLCPFCGLPEGPGRHICPRAN